MEISTHTPRGVEKTARYGWTTKDAPGVLRMLDKNVLRISDEYQRGLLTLKVAEMTSTWSWVGCGALIVGFRDGEYWVIDGQHRLMAARRRSDISDLPCIVFETESVKQEAVGFLAANTLRKPVSAIGKQKALLASGDKVAAHVSATIARVGLTPCATGSRPGHIKSVGWCMRRAKEDATAFDDVLTLAAEMSAHDSVAPSEKLLEGLWHLNANCGDGLRDVRLVKRLREKGAKLLHDAAVRSAAYYTRGGAGVFAKGMLIELNKGLRMRFELGGEDDKS